MERHVLSILVDNQAGVLSRICGLFSRRGYNIDSLSVGVTEDNDVSRITIMLYCGNEEIEQIVKQVEKLIDVIKIIQLDEGKAVFRELALIKVSSDLQKRSDIISIVNVFRANIIDVGTESLTIEVTGDENKIDALSALLKPFGIKEIVRTGITALCRGNNPIDKVRTRVI